MPSDTPNRILRGFKFATRITPADERLGLVCAPDAGEHRSLRAADVERELQQLVGALDEACIEHAGDSQVGRLELRDVDLGRRAIGGFSCVTCWHGGRRTFD